MHKTQQRIDYRLEIKVTVIAYRASGNVQDADLIAALLIAFLIVKFSLLHFYLATYQWKAQRNTGMGKAAINLRKQPMVFFSKFSQT